MGIKLKIRNTEFGVEKFCHKCKCWKLLAEFYQYKNREKWTPRCKNCVKEDVKISIQKIENRAVYLERLRKRRKRHTDAVKQGQCKICSDCGISKQLKSGFTEQYHACNTCRRKQFIELDKENSFKVCISCGEEKARSEFHRSIKYKDGRKTTCAVCQFGEYMGSEEQKRHKNAIRLKKIRCR